MRKSTKKQITTVFILLIFLASSVTYAIISAVPSGNSAAGWQAQLIIVIFGEQYPVPSNVGVAGNETTGKIYTISTDGVLYKSVEGDVALKDFFDAWGQTFNSTCILTYCNTNTSSVAMFVNDKANFEYENYIIQRNDFIVIDYR